MRRPARSQKTRKEHLIIGRRECTMALYCVSNTDTEKTKWRPGRSQRRTHGGAKHKDPATRDNPKTKGYRYRLTKRCQSHRIPSTYQIGRNKPSALRRLVKLANMFVYGKKKERNEFVEHMKHSPWIANAMLKRSTGT